MEKEGRLEEFVPDNEPGADWPNVEQSVEEKKKSILEKLDNELATLDNLYTAFKENYKIPCKIIFGDADIQTIYDRINFWLKPFLERRENLIEKQLTYVNNKADLETLV